MKLVPANYYVWSNDVARAFADSIYNFMDPEVAVERGLRLYWTPALDGLYKLLEECPDLSSLTSDKNQPEVAPANRSVESPGDQLPASNGETLVSPEVTPKPAEAPNRFFLQAEYWSITFEGKTKNFKNTLGFRYIEFLIRNQGEKIHVRDLLHAINPPDRETVDPTLSKMSAMELDEMGLYVTDLGDAGDSLTPEGEKRLKQAVKSLHEQIEDASERGDEELQAKLEGDQEKILLYINAEKGLGGRPRKASSNIERIRKSVSKRISGDIDKIGRTLPNLRDHLKQAINTGTQCQYGSHPPVEWLFDAE